jgi:hypothetical protein
LVNPVVLERRRGLLHDGGGRPSVLVTSFDRGGLIVPSVGAVVFVVAVVFFVVVVVAVV